MTKAIEHIVTFYSTLKIEKPWRKYAITAGDC